MTREAGVALRIELFSRFRVGAGSQTIPDAAWHRRRPAALVKLLALAPRHRLHRERVMDALWPDLDPGAAAANLRKALHHARRALDAVDAAAMLVSEGDMLLLDGRRSLWVDVDAFRSAVARARATGEVGAYAEAVELYGDGLLPEDAYESWAADARDELSADFVAVLEELAGTLEAGGDLDAAADAVSRLIGLEPLEEEAHARLIRLYALAGRRSEALRHYEQLRRILDVELGVEPSAATQRLVEEVRSRQAAEPELTADLWERVGDLRVTSGDTPGAVKAFGAALEAGVAPATAARLHRKLADAWLMQFDTEHAGPHLSEAEQLTADAAETNRLGRLRATQAWQRGDLDLAVRLAEETLLAARTLGSPDDLAAAQETVAIVSHMRGDWRIDLLDSLAGLAGDGAGQLGRVFDIHHCIGQYHLYGDGLSDEVEDYARRLLTLAERAQAVRAQAFAWCLLGEALLLQARWDEAAGSLTRSCELHASLGSRSGALPWQRLAELAVCTGSPEDAAANLRQASAIATVSPMARHLWGRIHATSALAALEQGAPELAARHVRAAAAAAARYGDCPSCSALLNPVAAEALASLGDAAGATSYADAGARVAGMFASSAWRAMAESAAGSAARAAGDRDGAAERFEAAADLYQRAGQPFWASRSAGEAASARERSGNGPALASAHIQPHPEVTR